MRVEIVGSRRRGTLTDRKLVFDIVYRAVRQGLHDGFKVTVVSGGASGPDSFAKEAARIHGCDYREYPIPCDPPIESKGEFVRRAFDRNREIVIDSDVVFALVHRDRKGGTENTISHAIELKKPYFLVDDADRCYLSGDGWPEEYGEEDDET